MSKPCFALVALLAVIALSEVQGSQKYLGHPWYLNGILPRSSGPAWDVHQMNKPKRPLSQLWWKSKGLFPPQGEPEVKPKPKPEYNPVLPPWWMKKGILTPGSQPEWKPKPEYKPVLPPWWMKTGILTPGSQPEWKPKPEYKPTFPIPENSLKGRYLKSELEWRPRIAINPQPRPEWRLWPGSYFPKSKTEWIPTPVYPPVYPVYPLPVIPRYPYPYSYPSFPFSEQSDSPDKQPPMPYVPIPKAYQYHVHPYGSFMKPSYPTKKAYPYNPMPKNPLYSSWLKQLLRSKAVGPSKIVKNNATQSNASSPAAANATISVRVELKHPNNTIIKNDLKLSKQPLKSILNILADRNECFNYTTFQRNSRITDGKVGEYVRSLCNTKEVYGSHMSSRYWLLYTLSGEKDLDVAYVPNNNTCIKMEYMNASRLYALMHQNVSGNV
ncbi:adhesive plaque matrix protein-like isoform X7 [Octopus sinensis]|uniref:Adhesive plaque matrix protein-like isoform X3 n=1 Tax=Octopus sinensis TaxID=2607531 RepID=A0A7E6EYF9_9MOLL|nr:adhesive plaque matrix protein-like isoform X3 [Octopus sinensis]XP_036360032.1 adhesive plaque matrix protein-like isoform X7 [Octopus sinensis]